MSTIRFTRHGRGLLDGLGIGFGTSLVAGLLAIVVPPAAGTCEGLAALACGFVGVAVTMARSRAR